MFNSNDETSSNNSSLVDDSGLLSGTSGDDIITGTSGDDIITGTSGDDIITGTSGNDFIDGGDGFDTIDYSDLGQAVTISAAGGVDNGGQSLVVNIEKYIGATGEANTIDGTVSSNNGTSFSADLSDDSLRINNIPTIGSLDFEVENFVNVTGTLSSDNLAGNDEANELSGNAGNDFMLGRDGEDVLTGGDGNDSLDAGDGDDQLIGSDGDDFLVGGSGDDVLNGGDGNNRMEGGSGSDTFVLADDGGTNNIVDFDLGTDIIGLSGGISYDDLIAEGNKMMYQNQALASFEGIETSELSADNFTSV